MHSHLERWLSMPVCCWATVASFHLCVVLMAFSFSVPEQSSLEVNRCPGLGISVLFCISISVFNLIFYSWHLFR